jgi:hypothetical protein
MHEHRWLFTLDPIHWTATCRCGLAVTVEEPAPGRSTWAWTFHGEMPPPSMMLDACGSVQRARRALLAAPGPAGN